MALRESLLPEFDHEMATTRKALERLPAEIFGWKPHEKSFSMGELVTHIITIPDWAVYTMEHDSLDISKPFHNEAAKSTGEVLERFDTNTRAARKSLEGAGDELLLKPWSLTMGEKVLLSMPRIAVLRSFVMSHLVHHRGQLTVYMRLNNIPVPSIYGPSADEQGM